MRVLDGLLCALLAAASLVAAAQQDYPRVRPGRSFAFPADTGAHPDHRNEWWYATGWLRDDAGVERGFQVTFFRVRTRIGENNPSRFAPRQLILAHAAVADPQLGRLRHAERAARAIEPLAGAATEHARAWIGDWSFEWLGDRYETRVDAEDFGFTLVLRPQGPPLLQGEGGFSRKAADPKYASHYYSRPQLEVDGSLRSGGERRAVQGRAWLDHEWSSEVLPPGARGWDWIGINLHDGGALMAFRMRDVEDRAIWAAGTLVEGEGTPRRLSPDEVVFEPRRRWRSPRTGTEYPVSWELKVAGRRLRLEPLMDDQELDSRGSTGAIYWEGAVRLLEDGREIGRGYLEMTGYAERLKM